jgi:hypothetical protein
MVAIGPDATREHGLKSARSLAWHDVNGVLKLADKTLRVSDLEFYGVGHGVSGASEISIRTPHGKPGAAQTLRIEPAQTWQSSDQAPALVKASITALSRLSRSGFFVCHCGALAFSFAAFLPLPEWQAGR